MSTVTIERAENGFIVKHADRTVVTKDGEAFNLIVYESDISWQIEAFVLEHPPPMKDADTDRGR